MLDNKEIWKDCKGYEGKYQISNLGRIWSVKRQQYMKPQKDTCGYLRIQLYTKNGKLRTEKVHRLVALAFIDNPDGKPEVNHINHVRDDNRVENLEWVTHKENSNKTTVVRSVGKFTKDGQLVERYITVSEAARKNDVKPSVILAYIKSKPQKSREYLYAYI